MVRDSYLTHISSERKLINFNFKELFQYRDLVYLFVRRDFVAKYKQTFLGPLWAVIQPLLTTVVFTVIFGSLANLTTLDVIAEEEVLVPGFLFYMGGTICWSYFSSTAATISDTFLDNRNIMGKVYFPRIVVPTATSISGLISFSIQFVMFVVLWVIWLLTGNTTMHLSVYVALLPLLILQMMLLAIGVGIIVSSLTTKYRDLRMLVSFALNLLQYATPVAYGLALIPARFQSVYLCNPMTIVITTFRYAFFGSGFFSWFYYVIDWVITIVIFIVGVLLFNYVERTFMDTI